MTKTEEAQRAVLIAARQNITIAIAYNSVKEQEPSVESGIPVRLNNHAFLLSDKTIAYANVHKIKAVSGGVRKQ